MASSAPRLEELSFPCGSACDVRAAVVPCCKRDGRSSLLAWCRWAARGLDQAAAAAVAMMALPSILITMQCTQKLTECCTMLSLLASPCKAHNGLITPITFHNGNRSTLFNLHVDIAIMANREEFQSNNASYVASFADGGKPMPPARKALVITCMDGAYQFLEGRCKLACPISANLPPSWPHHQSRQPCSVCGHRCSHGTWRIGRSPWPHTPLSR